jgi:hypothetical protein
MTSAELLSVIDEALAFPIAAAAAQLTSTDASAGADRPSHYDGECVPSCV